MNTDTPRTDAVRHDSGDETNPLMSPCSDGDWVPYEHAREQELRIAQLERELSQCIRRDDPRLANASVALENASFAKVDWKAAHNSHKQLQSIIEGQ